MIYVGYYPFSIMESGDRHWLAVLFLVSLTAIMVIWGVVGVIILIVHEPPEEEVELRYPDPIEVPVFFTYEIVDKENWTVNFSLKGPYDLSDPEKVYMMEYNDTTDPLDHILKSASFSHTFPGAGTYNVSLLVQDTTVQKNASFKTSVPLGKEFNLSPTAVIKDIEYGYYISENPITLSGEGSFDVDGEVIFYYWEFGDGTHSDVSKGIDGFLPIDTVQYTYDGSGSYSAKLWVMDNEYRICEEPAQITVKILNDP